MNRSDDLLEAIKKNTLATQELLLATGVTTAVALIIADLLLFILLWHTLGR